MPAYKLVDITCYCGAHHPNCAVGQPVKCSCGVTLHTQQKAHGDGRVWGTVPHGGPKYRQVYALIQAGESKLDAQYKTA